MVYGYGMCPDRQSNQLAPREGHVPVKNAELFYREVGQGRPIIVIHGGPGFDHTYLLPDMDRLADSYRLIYYDQRGRGKSMGDVRDISINTEIEDLEGLRKHLQLDSVAVLGHSWGGYLAMEYAIRYPNRVSHMILMDTSVASRADYLLFEQELSKRTADHEERLNALASGAKGEEGDLETRTEYYRIYFSTTIRKPEHLERLDLSFSNFTKEGVLRARAIGQRLINETWSSSEFNLIPQLKRLSIPTLIIHGDYDFIPLEAVTRIAQAVPGARFTLLKECGHFAYIESPAEVRKEIDDFFAST